jgi:protein tyrosine phosphatase domain-containing protein 1
MPSETETCSKWHRTDERVLSSWFDRARQGIHCTIGCGGAKCKHEDWSHCRSLRNFHPAIEGLNSSWVSDSVIASQRPSTSLFLKYLLVAQLRAKNVTGVFNLQEKGEHSSCGPDGIYASTGYSYDGEADLMRHGVSYYEFPWPDMTAPDCDIVLRSVQVMDYHVRSKGKVLVHCHAGLGRTGLMIACFLIYSQKMTSEAAIQQVRLHRPGSIQTSSQTQFVMDFEKHIWQLMQAFRVEISDAPIDLAVFVQRQKLVLHGEDSLTYKYVPKIIHVTLSRIVELCKAKPSLTRVAVESLAPSSSPRQGTLESLRLAINRGLFEPHRVDDVAVLSFIILDWFRALSNPVLGADLVGVFVEYMKHMAPERPKLSLFVTEHLDKIGRHTIGMLCSFVYVLCEGNDDGPLRRFAIKCLTEALVHGFDFIRVQLTVLERELLTDFLDEWCLSVRGRYFDDVACSPEHRAIFRIAFASKVAMDPQSRQGRQFTADEDLASAQASPLSAPASPS